ncbi:Sterol uptake control protein 2 [Pleurostoma richardsiae]|uniref:Sterol uptake control protein 2 n=1 Tax=Pleurostoma richardsiae TaxID=41990 RepID=A0AA38RJM3_9PEZI|nr:Sterol uptake control protein 2 [Pleurostoma richardsiae]
MDCVLGLSALHLQYLKQEISPRRAISYRVRAFEGYRKAIERANPNDFPALLACSLLLCALASQTFREPDAKDVFLIDWMIVWRGIGLIVELITPEAMFASGMQMLFNRPRLDLDKAALRIPNNLLFMVTSIKDGDVDFPYRDAYYDTLKYLGALYLELEAGFSPILDLSIITFFTFLPKPFIEVARQRRPRSLIILVYYAVFAKLIDRVWWMEGIADREILGICRMLSDEWLPLLQVPRMAVRVQNKVDLATLLLGNHAWEPSLEEDRPDPRDKTLAILDDYGQEVEYVGRWVTRLTFAPRPGESRDMMETGPHFRGDTVL